MAIRKATPRTVKATAETCRNETTGAIQCPKCRAPMVPLKGKGAGKGWACSKATWNRFKRKAEGCDGIIWNNNRATAKVVIDRAEAFPVIGKPTDEQRKLFQLMAMTPAQRGGRAVITDAGPGTAKTTSTAAGAAGIYNRRKTLNGFPFCAFNTNARDVMLAKLPAEVPDVATLNSWHAAAQGYRYSQYDAKKLSAIWKDLTDHIPFAERPRLGVIGKLVERMRDVCLFHTDEADYPTWAQLVAATLDRFPSLARKLDQLPGGMELVKQYLPALTVRAYQFDRKIDIQEQVTRPTTVAIARTGWRMRLDCVSKPASEWTDDDVKHFAKLIRAIQLPKVPGMIVDESQDLSLCQIAVILAQVWESGELFLIGDDTAGVYGQDGYKAGQAIYGWRGAFGGSLNLISRLWEELTNEAVVNNALTITFRHGPEICDAYRPLNTVIQSALPAGKSAAWQVNDGQAFAAWLALPDDQTALWITRTNAPLSGLLVETLRNHAECCIRGGADFMGTVDGALYAAAGYYDGNGEYVVSLAAAIVKLATAAAEADAEGQAPDPNSVERFVLEVAKAIQDDASILTKAELPAVATVGNLRRFINFYANRKARRVLTTVYRCKGDEADLAIVGDVARFNETWGDEGEDRACRHVALSRAKRLLLTVGSVSGSDMAPAPRSFGEADMSGPAIGPRQSGADYAERIDGDDDESGDGE